MSVAVEAAITEETARIQKDGGDILSPRFIEHIKAARRLLTEAEKLFNAAGYKVTLK